MEASEQKWPTTSAAFCCTSWVATPEARCESQPSSTTASFSFLPRTPPLALRSSIACCPPRFICSPMKANGPDIGPAIPTRIGSSFGALGVVGFDGFGAVAVLGLGGFGALGGLGVLGVLGVLGAPVAPPASAAVMTRNAARNRLMSPVPHQQPSRLRRTLPCRRSARLSPCEDVVELALREALQRGL